uniref:NADH dehydrogenase [ubiquinone] 1 beta subcomplex subunit 11, mitochondrial n=1 Tax=Aquila chrysaetos chrysaetos TaxID=223781 RepID=A0A663FGN1_AQUCH
GKKRRGGNSVGKMAAAAVGRALRALRVRTMAGRDAGPLGGKRGSWGWGGGGAPRHPISRQNPDYHGFSADPDADVLNMRAVFFAGVSVAIVLGTVFLHYLPDYGLQQWARREAELRIRERESRGLPLLDPNYYDPARLTLPPPE